MSRILVTGATRGLGRALVNELSRRDHEVVATGRRLADMADLPATERLVLDLTDPASIDEAMAVAGRLEVVINNAAMTVSGPVEAVPANLVEQVLVTNVLGPLRVMQAALPSMRERGAGRILNISSPAGRFAPPLEGVYSASKAALEMLSEATRFEAGHFGVQVTIIQPGTIRTEMADREQKFELPAYAPLTRQYAERFARYRERRPLGRADRPRDRRPAGPWQPAAARPGGAALGTAVRPAVPNSAGQVGPVALQVVAPWVVV